MINVNNQFHENNLKIKFSGDTIETNQITISVSNDVNFKPVIDYLIQLIPNRFKLTSTFENLDQEDNIEKLALIQETISGIYEKFNSSIDHREASENTLEEPIDENS
ncbi:hypothetical protein [Aquimarina latercula]|uniref:hypothetical protein n=1 Tax=Aquimarina latercula TaxID=987 RepID=UPI000404134A|nr:hypothetical protein [Aquimarina latercula]